MLQDVAVLGQKPKPNITIHVLPDYRLNSEGNVKETIVFCMSGWYMFIWNLFCFDHV